MLSIVFITCNRKETLLTAIESCYTHISIPWELIVVDNHSEDSSQKDVENFASDNNLNLNYIYLDKNYGVAKARNIGFEATKGDIAYFLDDDAIITSSGYCLDLAYEYMKENPTIFIMCTKIYDHKQKKYVYEMSQKGKQLSTGVLLRGFIGCSHFIRKQGMTLNKLYPDNLFYGGEELYLAFSCYDRGGSCCYYEDLEVHHYPSLITRLSEREIKINCFVNAYLIRKLVFPKIYWIIIFLMFLLNIFVYIKFDKSFWLLCCKRYKERYSYKDRREIHAFTIIRLSRLFGAKAIFK